MDLQSVAFQRNVQLTLPIRAARGGTEHTELRVSRAPPDEHDFPLTGNTGGPKKHEKIRLTFREFRPSMKRCAGQLRLVFIAGIRQFSRLPLFSSMNTAGGISLDGGFAKIYGFTKIKINASF
ncbi:MAG: AAA family ATPase [Deltaproteobacteria bacterium]|jgi:hypothetical protein|nr:AAA family ATPase [Deltaproteobacteria bacterium]